VKWLIQKVNTKIRVPEKKEGLEKIYRFICVNCMKKKIFKDRKRKGQG